MTTRIGQLRQDNRDGTTTVVERGYLGQDIQLRQGNQNGTIVPVETGQLGQDIRVRTVSIGRPDRQPGLVSLERTEMTGLPGHDSGVRRAVSITAWAGQLEQEYS